MRLWKKKQSEDFDLPEELRDWHPKPMPKDYIVEGFWGEVRRKGLRRWWAEFSPETRKVISAFLMLGTLNILLLASVIYCTIIHAG